MDRRVADAITQKHRAWNRYQKSRSNEDWKTFVIHRNKATTAVRRAKAEFETKIAEEVKDNAKSFWNYVKSRSKTNAGIPELVTEDGTFAKTDQDKAEVLNAFFGSVFTVEDLTALPTMTKISDKDITDIEFSAQEIDELLCKLDINKSPGPDGIHSRVLREAHEQVSLPLKIIFNKLMQEGCVPNSWRQAIVVPLFKKGRKSNPANYRPVSLTSVVCKVMEKLVRKAILKHLEEHDLISNDQHGFRSGRSCATQLLEVLEAWTKLLDGGHSVDCLYLDFKKAFDSVPHKRLLQKLEALGIRGHLLRWIEAYLSGRSQRVRVNGEMSTSNSVTSGIPQGSVLGPLLFICFINDLPNVAMSNIKLFADDTKLYRVVDTPEDANIFQNDVDAVTRWADTWQLQFNEAKCKVVHYGNKNPHFKYTMSTEDGEKEITQDVSEKDLGVICDRSLSFSAHTADVVKRANVKLGIIKRSFSALTEKGWLKLYKAIVRPTLEYCNMVWAPTFKKDEDQLEKVQQRATRLLPHLRHLDYPERLKVLGLPTLTYRRQRAELIQIYKIMKGIDHIDCSTFFELFNNSITRGHSLKVKKQRGRLQLRLNAFAMRSINNWNALPEKAVSAASVNQFKSALEKHWKDHPLKYNPYQRSTEVTRGK